MLSLLLRNEHRRDLGYSRYRQKQLIHELFTIYRVIFSFIM